MKRNRIRLINKALGLLKVLDKEKFELLINYSTMDIIIPNTNILEWDEGEKAIQYFIKNNVTWTLRFKDNNLIYRIQL